MQTSHNCRRGYGWNCFVNIGLCLSGSWPEICWSVDRRTCFQHHVNTHATATGICSQLWQNRQIRSGYRQLENLLWETFAKLVKLMHLHQQPSESVVAYVSELRCLAGTCDFGDNLDSSLRDQLVCGINEGAIQCRLLAEKRLDYNKTFALAQSTGLAAHNVQAMKQQSHVNTPMVSSASPQGQINKLSTYKFCQNVRPLWWSQPHLSKLSV